MLQHASSIAKELDQRRGVARGLEHDFVIAFAYTRQGMASVSPQTVYRYERKYLSELASAWQIEKAILLHPDVFHPAYYPREVWSMYFDTTTTEYYQQNLLGHTERVKVRVRWYEHDDQQDPLQIEIKQRQGEVLRKITYAYEVPITALSLADLTQLVQQQVEQHLPESGVLQPAMVNHYQRRYFTSNQVPYRLTVDSELKFATITDWQQGHDTHELPFTILEAKYATNQDPGLRQIAQGLPLRISKSSKFVMGMQQCHPNDVYYQ